MEKIEELFWSKKILLRALDKCIPNGYMVQINKNLELDLAA